MKKLLVIGLLFLPQSIAYGAVPTFNPLTGKIEEPCDLACSVAKLNVKPKDRLGREVAITPSTTTSATTHTIVIKDLEHSHLGTVGELTEIDMQNNPHIPKT